MDYEQKLLDAQPGIRGKFDRMVIRWLKSDDKLVRQMLAYYFIKYIHFRIHNLITFLTAYYPFSLLYQDRLFHANNVKARDLMRGMEAVALAAGMPVYINVGHRDRYFGVFEGKFERGGINKQKAVEKMQQLFQEKYGQVYVREEKVGFRVLVNSEML